MIWRPRPKSPTKPIETTGAGVGVAVGVGLGKMTGSDEGVIFLENRIEYNRQDMNKKIIVIKMAALLCGALFLSACNEGKAGLEISTIPTAQVYINGRQAGESKYKNLNLTPGEIDLKLVVSPDQIWERKIRLENNVTSVIGWNFDEDSGYILSMEKSGRPGSILVSSSPGGAIISVDNEIKNTTPAKIEKIEVGDRKLAISFPGYKQLNLVVRTVEGYQMLIDAKLGVDKRQAEVLPTVAPIEIKKEMVKILSTGTGWLRVRETPSEAGREIGKVNTGEKVELLGEEGNWYHVVFGEHQGFIAKRYAEKIVE